MLIPRSSPDRDDVGSDGIRDGGVAANERVAHVNADDEARTSVGHGEIAQIPGLGPRVGGRLPSHQPAGVRVAQGKPFGEHSVGDVNVESIVD